MSRFCLALISKSISLYSWANGVQARSIEMSAKIMDPPKRFLDYNTKLDWKDLAVNDPESPGLRTRRLSKRNDEMRRLGVIGPHDICFGRLGRSIGVGMEDRDKLLSGLSQSTQCRDQFRGIH